jgi:hypothetical protein
MSHQHWNTLIKWNISPNQIYLLDCYRSKIKPSKIINEEGERLVCQAKDLLDGNNNLTNKASIILDEYETFLVKAKKVVASQVLGEDMNERIKELVCRVERIKDLYEVGPVQRAAIEDFVGLIAQDCARLCEEVAKDADCIAKSEFVTDAGRQLQLLPARAVHRRRGD